ncbi:MAG TPA: hypothetical protein VGH88_00225 [Streptosporangiaceae bacterium]
MAIRITVEVDEDRLREAGLGTTADEVMAEVAGLREGRLSLQTRDHWLPVRDLRVRPR